MKIYKNKKDKGVPILSMKDGEICIVLFGECWEGSICQRHDDALIMLGENWDESCRTFFEKPNKNFRVKILPKGTLLEI